MNGQATTGPSEAVDRLVPVLLLAGFAVLLCAGRMGQTFWLDELWVVRLLRDSIWPEGPLPLLFRSLARLSGALLGFSEIAMRLPAVAGFAVLVLLPAAAPRRGEALLAGGSPLIWSFVVAFSSPLLFYACQTKQYTWDAATGAALLIAYLHFDRDPLAWHPLLVLLAICWLAILGVHPAPFLVLPIVGAACLRIPWRSLEPHRRRVLATLVTAAAMVLALTLLVVLARSAPIRAGLQNRALLDWWHDRFWDGSFSFVVDSTRHWLGHSLNLVRGGTLMLAAASLAFLLRGGASLPRRVLFLMIVIAPPAVALAASGLERYPYGEVRLMLFALPGALALLAAGLGTFSRATRGWGALLVAPFLVVYAINGGLRDIYNATYMRVHDAREVNSLVRSLWQPGTVVVAPPTFARQLEFYHPEMLDDLVNESSSARPRSSRLTRVRLQPGAIGASSASSAQRRELRIRLSDFEVLLVDPERFATAGYQ